MNELLTQISLSVQKGNARTIKDQINEAMAKGATAQDVLNTMLEAMSFIGVKFKNNEIFVPNVLVAARALNMGLELIKPALEASGATKNATRVVIGTIQGDQHDIGKNLVRMMLVGSGFEVVDLGTDVPAEKFVEAALANKAKIICISALLTTTMENMSKVVELLVKKGIRKDFIVMVGGAPLTPAFAEKIGADIYTPDAGSAAEEALKAIKKQ